MLKEFRSIDVYWDKATRRIYEEIRSSSSDEKGRKLTVQIVNDGQVQDLTNVALNLYWETQDGENRGLDPFEPLDAENGIYELYFRTGMLKHAGKLNAHLHLVDTTGAITSEPFTIVVFSGVDVDAIESDDSFTALTQALVEVQTIKEDYPLLDGRLAAVEQNIDEHLAENASKHIKESGSNENGSYIKFDDGTMICSGKRTGGVINANRILTSIISPATFIDSEARVHVTWTGANADVAPTANGLGVIQAAVPSPTGVGTVAIYRVAGQPDFVEGNVFNFDWVAIGRWK